jgi:methylated-DNA-protein-cysteine methyltransferase-like protein
LILQLRFQQKKFDCAVWKIVSRIKPGDVMSYGEVAHAAGFPRHARMVSKAMSRSRTPLPWYRVIRSDGTLAFEMGSASYKKQKALLEKEGVEIRNRKAIPLGPAEVEDLDKLLWGPPDSY